MVMEQQPTGPRPILLYSWTMSNPYEINESLNVYEDGAVWYWSLKPAAMEKHNRVGTFQFQLPDSELMDLQALAAELAEMPAGSAEPARNTIVAYVTGVSGDKSQPHLISEGTSPTIPAEVARAGEIGRDLMHRAESAPLAVVTMSWSVVDAPVRAGAASAVNFNFENSGLRPVFVQAKPDAYTLYEVHSNGGSTQLWQGSKGFTTGIQAADQGGRPTSRPTTGPGALAGDGIYAPAEIAPGKGGRAFCRDAFLVQQAGSISVGAAVRGSITLYYPPGTGNPLDEKYPNWGFYLETAPLKVQIVEG